MQASFILSSGDQIQTNAEKVKDGTVSEMEYAGYLSPDIMKSVPVATTVGNHDADNANYTYHFNTANLSDLGDNGYVGGDYYFTYGGALFIILNTQDTNVSEHKQFILLFYIRRRAVHHPEHTGHERERAQTVYRADSSCKPGLQMEDRDSAPGYLRFRRAFQ